MLTSTKSVFLSWTTLVAARTHDNYSVIYFVTHTSATSSTLSVLIFQLKVLVNNGNQLQDDAI